MPTHDQKTKDVKIFAESNNENKGAPGMAAEGTVQRKITPASMGSTSNMWAPIVKHWTKWDSVSTPGPVPKSVSPIPSGPSEEGAEE